MIILTRTYTRPDTAVEWHIYALNNPQIGEYIQTTYIDTGKLLLQNIEWENPNLLSIEYTAYWRDMDSFNEYDNDPNLLSYWEERDVYNNSVGITITPKVITDIES